LATLAQGDAEARWRLYQALAARDVKPKDTVIAAKSPAATVSDHP
jgi:hypothetical protein